MIENKLAFFVTMGLASILTVAGVMDDDWCLGIMGVLWLMIYVGYKVDEVKKRVDELEKIIKEGEKGAVLAASVASWSVALTERMDELEERIEKIEGAHDD